MLKGEVLKGSKVVKVDRQERRIMNVMRDRGVDQSVCSPSPQTACGFVSRKRILKPLAASKFDPSLLRSSKKGGRRKKDEKGEGKSFEGLSREGRFRGPKNTEYADEEIPHPLVAGVISGALDKYFDGNSPLYELYEDIFDKKFKDCRSGFDYLEFRTFEMEGMGFDHIASFWEDYGYKRMDEAELPDHKVKYRWLSPPEKEALPRILICSINPSDLSSESESIIKKRLGNWSAYAQKHISGAIVARTTPWEAPTLKEFEGIYNESDFAAWILINGYAVSNAAISVNSMRNPLYRFGKSPDPVSIEDICMVAQEQPSVLLTPVEGKPEFIHEAANGKIKQIATLAIMLEFVFADGQKSAVVGSYMSAVERMPSDSQNDPKGDAETGFYNGFDAKLMNSVIDSTRLALALISQQLQLQQEIQRRAQMDGHDLTGEKDDPYQQELLSKYVDIVLKEMAEQATPE